MSLGLFNHSIIFNLILIVTFSVSVNSFEQLANLNILFYIIFHLTFIYYIFYHYHYLHFVLGFIYGVLFDIFLLNTIGAHLICFVSLILIYILMKKYLFLFSAYQISITIFITLNTVIFSEMLLAFLLDNIYFTINYLLKFFIITSIIFVPSIFILNKLDK